MRIGVLADTHGTLRASVADLLGGCDRLLHAGDVGEPEVLARLRRIAPVEAVRGNVDGGPVLGALPAHLELELGGVAVYMTHRQDDLDPTRVDRARLVVWGHSHRPELAWQGRRLLLNPGSCGPRRFHLPLTLAIVEVHGERLIPALLPVEEG